MTIPTNLWQKTNAGFKGNREDLLDKIFNTAKTDTPITSAMGRTTATSDFHEWQTDSLAAVDPASKMVEGDDATLAVLTGTSRLGNHLHRPVLAGGETGRPHNLLTQRQVSRRIERARECREAAPDRTRAGDRKLLSTDDAREPGETAGCQPNFEGASLPGDGPQLGAAAQQRPQLARQHLAIGQRFCARAGHAVADPSLRPKPQWPSASRPRLLGAVHRFLGKASAWRDAAATGRHRPDAL
mgnify:CR=1 FL=1